MIPLNYQQNSTSYWNNQQDRQNRKDQSWRRLETINKIAQSKGYNSPFYSENRTIAELLQKNGEFSYLTGKKLGTFYLATLDFDLRKTGFPEELIKRLEKNVTYLLTHLRASYDQTKKGLHLDILTSELLENQPIYYFGWGKTWNVGSIQSRGKYVVGSDPEKTFIQNGSWYWKAQNLAEIQATLKKFFFELVSPEIKPKPNPLTLLKKLPELAIPPTSKFTIQAKVLSKKKVLNLEQIWKVFYLNWKTKQTDCFLVNSYQREQALDYLRSGSVQQIWLVKGRKWDFFVRPSLPARLVSYPINYRYL